MNDYKKTVKFNYFEKLYLKLSLGFFGLSISLFIITLFIINQFSSIPKLLINFSASIFMLVTVNFILQIIRLFRFLFKIRKLEDNIGIKRTVISLILSPITAGIIMILLLMMSLASCSIQ